MRGGPTSNAFGPQGFSYGSVFSMNNPWKCGASKYPIYSFHNVGNPSLRGWNYQDPQRLPFLATLNFPYLSKLTNDPIRYNPCWPLVPTKLPLNIPKFEGNIGEDPANHVTTFHVWCSSNSLIEDSIRLRRFQCALTGNAAKRYIELTVGSFSTFGELATMFLNHFQFPICYDARIDLLANFQQDKATHISDHI